jgi:hypothetical protein
MPTFIPCHLGFKGSRGFQAGRKHGAIGELDADFRAVDTVLIDGEAANGFSDEVPDMRPFKGLSVNCDSGCCSREIVALW